MHWHHVSSSQVIHLCWGWTFYVFRNTIICCCRRTESPNMASTGTFSLYRVYCLLLAALSRDVAQYCCLLCIQKVFVFILEHISRSTRSLWPSTSSIVLPAHPAKLTETSLSTPGFINTDTYRFGFKLQIACFMYQYLMYLTVCFPECILSNEPSLRKQWNVKIVNIVCRSCCFIVAEPSVSVWGDYWF